jgi:hypothetical protein
MSKMKDLIVEIVDQYRSGISVPQISNFTGLPMDVVFDILKRYGSGFDDEVVLH